MTVAYFEFITVTYFEFPTLHDNGNHVGCNQITITHYHNHCFDKLPPPPPAGKGKNIHQNLLLYFNQRSDDCFAPPTLLDPILDFDPFNPLMCFCWRYQIPIIVSCSDPPLSCLYNLSIFYFICWAPTHDSFPIFYRNSTVATCWSGGWLCT